MDATTAPRLRMYRLLVHGNPVPKARARVVTGKGRKGWAMTPARTVGAEDAVTAAALEQIGLLKHEGPVAVHWRFYRSTRGVCDYDNLSKLATDACTGILWVDDDQIVAAFTEKHMVGRGEGRTEGFIILAAAGTSVMELVQALIATVGLSLDWRQEPEAGQIPLPLL